MFGYERSRNWGPNVRCAPLAAAGIGIMTRTSTCDRLSPLQVVPQLGCEPLRALLMFALGGRRLGYLDYGFVGRMAHVRLDMPFARRTSWMLAQTAVPYQSLDSLIISAIPCRSKRSMAKQTCKRKTGCYHRSNRCRSSVVEHSLGKGEVESSIPSGSTIKTNEIMEFLSVLGA